MAERLTKTLGPCIQKIDMTIWIEGVSCNLWAYSKVMLLPDSGHEGMR